VLGHVWLLEHDKVVEELLVVGLLPLVLLALSLVHDQSFPAVEQVLGRRHPRHPIGQVSLRCQVVLQAGRAQAENLQGSALNGLVLGGQNADELIPVLAHELLVRPLAKVHDKVARVEAQRLGHTKQIGVLIDKSDLLLARVGLDNTIVC